VNGAAASSRCAAVSASRWAVCRFGGGKFVEIEIPGDPEGVRRLDTTVLGG